MSYPVLKKWNPKKLKIPFASTFIGSRGSGKSTLLRFLFETYWADKFDVVCVFSHTNEFEEVFQEFVPGDLFFNSFNPVVVKSIFHQQSERIKSGKPPLQVLIILDDCGDDGEKYSSEIREIYTRGRHYFVSICNLVQETIMSGTVARSNSDFIIIGRTIGRGQENAIESFLLGQAGEIVDTKEKKFWREMIKKYTREHSFIVVLLSTPENDFEHNILQYKADIKTKTKKKKVRKQETITIIETE